MTAESEVPSNERSSTKSAKASRSRRSSLFANARMSFIRSSGDRGASIETLRGTTGATFEGKASVERMNVAESFICGCFGSGMSKTDFSIVLVKGPFCFIFSEETAKAPKYAISLVNMKAAFKNGIPSSCEVYLETVLGDIEYEFTFDDNSSAKLFLKAVEEESTAAGTEAIRKRLGHEHLLNKRSSIRFAESVARKKVDEAPDRPMSTEQILAGAAMVGM